MKPAAEPSSRFGRVLTEALFGAGGGVASTVYGTIVVMATLTVGYASETHPWTLAVVVATTACVLWVAHLYAHGLSESLSTGRRFSEVDIGGIARREIGILLAAVAPIAMLLLGASDVISETSAVWLALGIGLVTLAVEGLRYARLGSLGPAATLVAVGVNVSLGLLVVLLKAALAH